MLKLKKLELKYVFILVAGLAVVFTVYFYFSSFPARQRQMELAAVEIKEYQGENLSSVNDFRENSIKGPQAVNRETYRLKISGLASGKQVFSYDDIVKNQVSFRKIVTLNCVEGWSAKILWEGFLIKNLIKKEEVAPGAKTVIFRAVDGYSTSFPIEYIFDNDIMIAYKMNGLELPPERGFPFQLIAESKWGYKWIKWISEIEFSPDADYEGYWESRGYSATGNLEEDFLDK